MRPSHAVTCTARPQSIQAPPLTTHRLQAQNAQVAVRRCHDRSLLVDRQRHPVVLSLGRREGGWVRRLPGMCMGGMHWWRQQLTLFGNRHARTGGTAAAEAPHLRLAGHGCHLHAEHVAWRRRRRRQGRSKALGKGITPGSTPAAGLCRLPPHTTNPISHLPARPRSRLTRVCGPLRQLHQHRHQLAALGAELHRTPAAALEAGAA